MSPRKERNVEILFFFYVGRVVCACGGGGMDVAIIMITVTTWKHIKTHKNDAIQPANLPPPPLSGFLVPSPLASGKE